MALDERLRQIWHDFFYKVGKQRAVRLALRCQDVATQIDLEEQQTLIQYFRFKLHLSLCQACKNYDNTSVVLKTAIKNLINNDEISEDARLEKLNKELLIKHSTTKSP